MECDWIVCTYADNLNNIIAPKVAELSGKSQAEINEKIKAWVEVHWPKLYSQIEPYLKTNTKFMFGNKLTEADFMIGAHYCNVVANPNCFGRAEFSKLLKDYPLFDKFGKAFMAENQRYLSQRAVRPM
jgi:hypothetical protein